MYVRVLHIPLLIDCMALVRDHYWQVIYPHLCKQMGFIAAYLEEQLDPTSCLLVTCWQDAEFAQALEADANLQWAIQQLGVYFSAQPTEYGFWIRMPLA